VLLEAFAKSRPDDDDVEYAQMIDNALAGVLQIQKGFQARSGEHTDEMKMDVGCIVCYNEVADTVLVPCGHLVLCSVFFRSQSKYREMADGGRRVVIIWGSRPKGRVRGL
jgi:hypothetical protein